MLQKHLFKKYLLTSLLFLIGLLIGFFLLSYINSLFRIQHIEVIGVSSEERKRLSLLLKGVSTLTVQPSEIQKLITMQFPLMKVKESRIQFPSRLILVVEKDKPIAYLRTDSGYMALSKKGMIVRRERISDIPNPTISFYQTVHHSEFQIGQYIGYTAVKRALIFIALLVDEGYELETVAIDSVDMIACKTKGLDIIFSQSRPVELQLFEAGQIIRQIKGGALRIARLDLRFDKPVVQLLQK